jgi:glyoxylase I family protein
MSAIHHVGLTVTALDASASWYASILGFERVGEYALPDGTRQKVFLRHPELAIRLGLTLHTSGPNERFDETRVGLDHLSLRVDSEIELAEWQAHLDRHHVPYTPATPANSIPGAQVVVFRDPDNIQLELIFDPTPAPPNQSGG